MPELNEQQIERIAERAADKAAEKTARELLTKLGIDVNNPIDTQEEMAFLRKLKAVCESVGMKIVMAVVGVVVLGICAILGSSLWPK